MNKENGFIETEYEKYKCDFQTPPAVCKYMVSLLPPSTKSVLEPSPGIGNLVAELNGYDITAPDDFFLLEERKFDAVVMNPPFSSRYTNMSNAPLNEEISGMRMGYYFLTKCMEMSDSVIALMPWFTISDSDLRLRHLKNYGIKSLTALPRKTFRYARIQTVVIELNKGYSGDTKFHFLDF